MADEIIRIFIEGPEGAPSTVPGPPGTNGTNGAKGDQGDDGLPAIGDTEAAARLETRAKATGEFPGDGMLFGADQVIIDDVSGYILARHAENEPLTVEATDGESIDAVKRAIDPAFERTMLIGEGAPDVLADMTPDGVDRGGFDALDTPRFLGLHGEVGYPLILKRARLDNSFVIGENLGAPQSYFAPPAGSNEVRINIAYGQSYTYVAPADVLTDTYSTSDRLSGIATMSRGLGDPDEESGFRSGTTAYYFDTKGVQPLKAVIYPEDVPSVGELYAIEAAYTCSQRELAECSSQTRQHWCIVGRGGWAANWLGPGSPQFMNLTRQIRLDIAHLRALGLTPVPGNIIWSQGEEDYNTPVHVLKPIIWGLFRALRDMLAAECGSDKRAPIITYAPMRGVADTGVNKVCAATLVYNEMAEQMPGEVVIACAAYAAKHNANQHPDSEGTRQLGWFIGNAMFESQFGVKGFQPMRVIGRPIPLSSTSVRLLVQRPSTVHPTTSTLLRQSGTSPIGNPTDNTAANYIGDSPTTPSAGRSGGIWTRTEAANSIGVTGAAFGSEVLEGVFPLDLTFSSAWESGRTVICIGARSQNGSNSGGTQENGPRTLFYCDTELTIPDGSASFYHRLIPSEHVIYG